MKIGMGRDEIKAALVEAKEAKDLDAVDELLFRFRLRMIADMEAGR